MFRGASQKNDGSIVTVADIMKTQHSLSLSSVSRSGNLCEQPLETGPCRAFIRRYGFNPQTGRCQFFTYGGCAGNANNFETEEECMARCGGAGSADFCRDVRCGPNARCEAGKCVCEQGYEGDAERGCQPIQSVASSANPCELPFETGPCRAFVRRFGFNPRTGRCEAFTYGGCRGNENKFETEEECTARCRVTPLGANF
ncbi:unnamed protein product [Dibothriocephalus latus]|uniref:BPTI/Kunitz inhibitor domain-containing protein n=1 Tax=Dibothriocephalus latus TaxID=60516 RepID=A0A3P7NW82_DIBLA|nr:unnamed protein product [Dibothriocephalus latus]